MSTSEQGAGPMNANKCSVLPEVVHLKAHSKHPYGVQQKATQACSYCS